MGNPPLEELFLRYRRDGDAQALAAVFDRAAGEVMRLAVHLASDRSVAEDLVQNTFVTAIESAAKFDARRPLMPWLLGILANQAHRERERTGRRPDPKLLRTEAINDPHRVVEERELSAALAAALRDIRDPYRQVLELHLRHGLEPAAIANVLRRPPGTVRSQLHRGLDLVRRALPQSYAVAGTTMAASLWLQGSAAAAIRGHVLTTAGGTAAAPVTTLVGGILVKKVLLSIAAIGVLSTIALVAWNAGSPDAAPGPDGPAANAPPTPLAAKEPQPELAGAPQPENEPAPEAGGESTARTALDEGRTWVVAGKTLRGYQETYPHGNVLLRVFAGYEATGEPIEEAHVKSDADGVFRWPLVPPTSTVTVRVEGEEENHSTYSDSALVIAGGPPPTSLTVHLYPLDCTVEGVVKDTSGQPIAGASVRTSGGTIETDETGHYELTSSSVRDQEYVYATAPGFAQKRAIAELGGPGSTNTADFALAMAFRVRGRVVDETGRGVEGAVVQTFFTSRNVAVTDASGHFVLDHLDPQRERHSVYARKDGYVEAQVRVSPDGSELELADLVLNRGVRVEGRVFDQAGQALAGVEIYIGFSPSAYNRLDAISRDDGSFVFPHVPDGDQTMVASLEGFAPDSRVLQLDGDQSLTSGVLIQLTRGHFVAGIARDEAGEPMTGVNISPRHQGEYFGKRYKTGTDGRFRIEDLPGEQVKLEFWGTGIVRQNVAIETFDHEDLEVVIEAAGQVAGRVIDGATGEPLQEFTIRFVRTTPLEGEPRMGGYGATWAREGHRFVNTDGYWDSGDEDLTPGAAIGIEARAEGYASGRLDRVVATLAPDRDAWVVSMYPGARVSGRVLDGQGRPAQGAKVGLKVAGDPVQRFMIDEPYESGVTHTDAEGMFAFDAATPGKSILLVKVAGRPVFQNGPFQVPETGAVERRVQVPGGAELTGRALTRDGTPITDRKVQIYASEVEGVGHHSDSVATDADGAFTFTGLPNGLYQLSLTEEEEQQSVYTFTRFTNIEDGQDKEVVLQAVGTGSVRGTVRMADGTKIPAVVPVSCQPVFGHAASPAEREAAPPLRGAFARDGQFELHALPPGAYRISVHVWGQTRQLTGGSKIELAEGARERVEVELTEMPRRR